MMSRASTPPAARALESTERAQASAARLFLVGRRVFGVGVAVGRLSLE
jgi:hypothetical protein